MIDFIRDYWPLLVLVGGGAALFYVIVLQMRRLDPGHNEPLRKRLWKWTKEMFDLLGAG